MHQQHRPRATTPKIGLFASLRAALVSKRVLRPRGLILPSLLTTIAALALTAAPANAFLTRPRILSSAPFSQPGVFGDPTGVAVNQETGNVYVVNDGADAVDVFGADGGSPADGAPAEITGLDGLAISNYQPQEVAVDNACYFQHKSGGECQAFDPSNGDVYVAEHNEDPQIHRTIVDAVAKFKLNALGTAYELVETLSAGGHTVGVAVDTEGDVYVTNYGEYPAYFQPIAEFDSAGVKVGEIKQHIVEVPTYVAVGAPGVLYAGTYNGGVAKVEVNAKDEVEHEASLGGAKAEAVAVDSHGNVYLDEFGYSNQPPPVSVSGYGSSGVLFEEFGLGFFEESQGVAVNDATEDVYVSSSGGGDLAVFGPSVIGPAIDGESASAVTSTSAALAALVNPNKQETHAYLQYSTSSAVNVSGALTTATPTETPPGTDLGSGEGDRPLGPAALTGLTAGTTYYYQAVASNAAETTYGEVRSFTAVPTPTTEPVSPIGATTATFNGELTPLNHEVATEYFFYYNLGEEPVCTGEHETVPHESAGTGAGGKAVSTLVTGLEPNQKYTVCLVATNVFASEADLVFTNAFGSEEDLTPVHFKTEPAAPDVVTEPPTDVATSSATLDALLSPNNEPTTYFFEYSTSEAELLASKGIKVAGAPPAAELGGYSAAGDPVSVSTGAVLTPHRTYYYRVVAENEQSKIEAKPVEGNVVRFGTGPLETPGKLEANPVGATTATLKGVLSPDHLGSPGAYEFLYQVSAMHCVGGASSAGSALGNEQEAVEAKLENLLPNTTYTFCLRASNVAGEKALSAPVTFTTSTEPPTIAGEASSEVTSSSVRLSATVNPDRDPSSYFFQYGTTTAYGSATSPASVGGGSEPVPVFARLSELQQGTEYHFRVVAENANGETAQGGDETFKTSVSYVYPPGVAGLPDGRNYELVSALENENANVYTGIREYLYGFDESTEGPMQVSADGGAVTYMGEPSAGGTGSLAPGGNQYLATRVAGGGGAGTQSSSGWAASNITLTGLPSEYMAAFSSALANAGTSSVPAFSHVLSSEPAGLVDETGGRPVPVSVLPDGQAAPEATFGFKAPTTRGLAPPRPDLSGVISADGSRVFWTDLDTTVTPEDPTGVTRLFVRENDASPGASTVQVDASALAGTETEKADKGGGGTFWTASSDGSKVYFTDEKRLTEDSTAAPGAPDLYVYDVETGQLSDLTVDATPGEHADVHGVLGTGESPEGGAYVYFVAAGALASGATPQTCEEGNKAGQHGSCNLYVLHESEQPRFIAALVSAGQAGGDNEISPSRADYNYGTLGDWHPSLGLRTAEVTPDGRHLAFMEGSGYSTFGEVLVYDVGSGGAGSLTCASCDPDGGPSGGRVPTSSDDVGLYMPQFISDDGSRVFFESTAQLNERSVPNTRLGKLGVYEWERDGTGSCRLEGGCIYLLSSGVLIGASATGDDVFVIAKEDLVPQNKSEDIFVYDVRVGAPPPLAAPACTSTGCQGPPAAAPIFATPSSVTFAGTGNFPPPPPPPPKKVVKKVTCKKHFAKDKKGKCVRVKRKKTKKAKRASNDRRAGR